MNIEARLIPGMNVSQELNLAPQLLQWLKLLQMPSAELSTLVNQELETNPALELDLYEQSGDEPVESALETDVVEDFLAESTSFDEDNMGEKFEMLAECDKDWGNDLGPSLSSARSDDDGKHDFIMNSITDEDNLNDHLLSQLSINNISEDEVETAQTIIGSLDKRGYLTISIEEIAEIAGVTTSDAEATLRKIQAMNPAGIAARDLKECLILQMDDKTGLAAKIVNEYLELIANRQYALTASELGVDENDVMEAVKEIRALNPEPGTAFSAGKTHYVSPDVLIESKGNDFEIILNDQRIPNIKLSTACRNLMASKKLTDEETAYLRKKIRSASFIIQGIKQRQDTLKKVAREIVNSQREYLTSEEGMLQPLTMAKVAARIGVHETTVSRALANKYMQTPRGMREMRFFFKSGYKCADGSAIVPSGVKDMITGMIEKENKLCPLTDLQIVAAMKKQGVTLARRTVAKYREELGIPSSKERHSYEKTKANIKIRVVGNSGAGMPAAARQKEKAYA